MPNSHEHGNTVSRMKNKRRLVFFLLACTAIAATGYWYQVTRFQETTDNAYLQSDIVYISSKQDGYAEAGWITDNQPVKEGEVLARIEDSDYQLKVQESQAAILAAEAAVSQLASQLNLQKSLITVAEAKLSSTQASLTLAISELSRVSSLFKLGAVSEDQLDSARTTEHKYWAQQKGDQANLESSRRQIAVLNSQIKAAQASLLQARTRVEIAEQKLAETIIKAPRDGVIGQRQVKDGQFVKAGSVLFTLVDSDTVWVTANFKETQVGQMQAGQPVDLDIDAFPGQTFTGYIDSLWPASGARFSLLPPENATGNFTKIVQRIPVKIVIPANQPLAGQLRAGMSVVATVDTRSKPVDLSRLLVADNNINKNSNTLASNPHSSKLLSSSLLSNNPAISKQHVAER